VGENSVAADAEILAVAMEGLRLLGLTERDVVARVNDRRLLERLLLHIGVTPQALGAAYGVIDKIGREPEAATRDRLRDEASLAGEKVDAALAIFAHESFEALAAAYADVPNIEPDLRRMREYFAQLEALGLSEYVRFDPRIVRGLAYYTGIVFEIFDRAGELRAICGGGRYDNLLKTVSPVDLPALGFGMGDVVLAELLSDRGLLPDSAPSVDYYIIAVTESEAAIQKEVARRLRSAGRRVMYSFVTGSVGKQFKDADARGARYAVVLGPSEVAEGVAVVREMASGQEERVRLEDLATWTT
jgi:histidyl-tRNA synthetase